MSLYLFLIVAGIIYATHFSLFYRQISQFLRKIRDSRRYYLVVVPIVAHLWFIITSLLGSIGLVDMLYYDTPSSNMVKVGSIIFGAILMNMELWNSDRFTGLPVLGKGGLWSRGSYWASVLILGAAWMGLIHLLFTL